MECLPDGAVVCFAMLSGMFNTIAVALLCLALVAAPGRAQRLVVEPADALVDEPVHIQVTGLDPEQVVVLRAATEDMDGRTWSARASFVANGSGVVDVARDPAISGSYYGVDPMGLLWSMRLDPDLPAAQRQGAILSYELEDGGVVELAVIVKDSTVAVANAIRRYVHPGVSVKELREHGFVARLFEPGGSGPHPAIIVVGGSDGGYDGSSIEAALLASRGYVTLALAYFGIEGVSEYLENIPLEYFERAMDWVRNRNDVNPEQLGLSGVSRGGELVLLLASKFPEVKAVVSIAGSHVVWDAPNGLPSWTFNGMPIPHMESTSPVWGATMAAGRPNRFLAGNLAELEDREDVARSTIAVEEINGAVLLISGKDDQVWPSALMFEAVMDRLRSHHHRFEHRHLSYEDAGHGIPIPYAPTTEMHTGGFMLMGGTPKADYLAGIDAWRNEVEFFETHLHGD